MFFIPFEVAMALTSRVIGGFEGGGTSTPVYDAGDLLLLESGDYLLLESGVSDKIILE